MNWPAFPCIDCSAEQLDGLLARLAAVRQIWRPQAGSDGLCRLSPSAGSSSGTVAQLPLIPLKKLLFPDGEALWRRSPAAYAEPPAPPALLLLDVALCDLQGLAWLDRCFASDPRYAERRRQAVVVGTPCQPGADCACTPAGLCPGGDLFSDGERLWALSPSGVALLKELRQEAAATWRPLPGPLAPASMQAVSEAQFAASAGLPLWEEAAASCLGCGACSAVCPTCSCYEVLDDCDSDTVTRRRYWDNCFFTDHARVAGGHDFRPGRGQRLRFRFEHKRIGLGAERGHSSCVGCGRCRRACPVGIDLEPLARRLAGSPS